MSVDFLMAMAARSRAAGIELWCRTIHKRMGS